MQERTNLEIRRVVEECKTTMAHVEEVFTEARGRFDGAEVLGAIGEMETTYQRLAELVDANLKQDTDNALVYPRERFKPDIIKQWESPDKIGSAMLTVTLQHAERAVDALDRWIEVANQGRDFAEHRRNAFNQTASALSKAYLITAG